MTVLERPELEVILNHELAVSTSSESVVGEIVENFLNRYEDEPWRHYHVVNHLGHMTGFLAGLRDKLRNPRIVFASTLGHDSVYIPQLYSHPISGLNEELSAQLTESAFGVLYPRREVKKIGEYIRATAHHGYEGGDSDLGYFLDADMSILAAEPDVFDEYDDNICREFSFLGLDLFRQGRKKFLSEWAGNEKIIFAMPDVREELEERAKDNLTRKLVEYCLT